MESNLFEYLLPELIIQIGLSLTPAQLTALCQTEKRLNAVICQNNYFWRLKFIKDFGPVEYQGDWKQLYQSSFQLWGWGGNSRFQLGLSTVDAANQLKLDWKKTQNPYSNS